MVKYKNRTKKLWRRWAWNEMGRRLPPGSSVMVYAGDSAMDYQEGLRRGFEVHAVDIVEENVKKFREEGGIATTDKFHRQQLAGPTDGAIIDALGGITDDSFRTPVGAANLFCKVIAWNGLRGRDPDAVRLTEDKGDFTFYDFTNPDKPRLTNANDKHRGKKAWLLMACHNYSIMANGCFEDRLGLGIQVYNRDIIRTFSLMTKPAFYSYQSEDSNQIFDSVVFRSFHGGVDELRSIHKSTWDISQCKRQKTLKKSKQRAAARKAVATARRNSN